jgi:hypothetical protein
VAISILIDVILWDSLSPGCTTFKLDVINVDASVNDVNVNAFAATVVILVLGESAESKPRPVAYTCKPLVTDCKLYGHKIRSLMTHPWSRLLYFHGTNDLVFLNVIYLRHRPELLNNAVCKAASISTDMTVIDLLNA